ncbi:uncharacterized membrane protein YgaE (UPF0421/DUF939 family) [Bacilli bacterium PM5-3]|nr:uncharacterized membrane protein YgaE (UPF0421/DUF939 family) [Bacilli bacterium PM5-3]MDH6603320.1 uncharacterized membrane protein YgaE (UPF0421/DUF939 family) [Bacilli bacterium PM5-9]
MKTKINALPLRILKTVFAFFISLVLSPFFHCESFFAGIGSLKSMRESLTLSIHALFEQMSSNFIAFIFAIVYSYLFGLNPYSISFALLCLFIIIKKINFIDTYLTAAFTLVALMMLASDQTDLISRSFDRLYSTFFGMLIALIVNAILFRPRKADDLNQILLKLNQYIHIFMAHDLEEYSYIELKNTLDELKKEKSIAKEELNVKYISQTKKQDLIERLIEINLVEAQTQVVFELPNINDDFKEAIIPIIIQLNKIKQYPSEKDEIPSIKKEIKSLYTEYTNDENFFVNTNFLSNLNIYIDLLREYNRIEN